MNQYLDMPCPQCRHELRVRAEYVGRRVRCKYCEHAWVVPLEDSESGAPRPRADGALTDTAIVGWSWPEAPRGPVNRLGDYELLEDLSHVGLTAVYRARYLADGHIVTLRIEGKVLADGPAEGAGQHSGAATIPGYQVLGTIREGAMGRVYKALQSSLDRFVAIKVLRRPLSDKPDYRERFLREAKIAARLSHHRFIQTIDAGEADGLPFYVMEYIEGETLECQLSRRAVMDERAAITVARGVTEAIRHAHQRGVIHRDIKPANVILTADGGLKLADLGLARSVDDQDWAAAEAGMAVGTPEYISPEQIRGQVDVDVRSDIYSLGATLYRMVTGRVPYGGETPQEVMSNHLARDNILVPPERINPTVSVGLSAVIQRMLARNRENRYRLPDDLIHALCGLLSSQPPRPSESGESAR